MGRRKTNIDEGKALALEITNLSLAVTQCLGSKTLRSVDTPWRTEMLGEFVEAYDQLVARLEEIRPFRDRAETIIASKKLTTDIST